MAVDARVFASEEAWHKHRRVSLGSSDAPTIVGASSFESPFGLWAVKTGRLEWSYEETRRLRAGHALEGEIHKELLVERPEIDLFDPGDHSIIFDTETPWRHATLDRLYGPKGCFDGLESGQVLEALSKAEGVAEFKTVSGWMKESWSEEPSAYAIVQTHHQMLVTGLRKAIVAAWFGLGEDFRVYDLEAVPALLDGVDRAERAFQRALDTNEPPDPDESERTSKALAALWPTEELETVMLDEEAAEWFGQLQKAKDRRNEQNHKIREAENWLKAMIADHEAGEIPGVATISWKTITRSGKSYRQLRIKEVKK